MKGDLKMYCKKCGSHVPDGAKFCQNCGLQNPAPDWQQPVTTAKSTPQQAPVVSKKKFPLWIIIAIIAVVVIIIIVASSSGSGSLEKDLMATLPRDITSYVLKEDDCVHMLEVKDLSIERHSENGNYDTADCVIELEDDYMKMTAYVTLNSTKYDTGWVVESWGEIQEPVVVAKYEPDKQQLQTYAKGTIFKNFTTLTDEFDLEAGEYNYVCSVNDTYKYVSYSGTISLISKFKKIGYDRVEELNEYGWSYSVDEDISAQWDIFGEWKIKEYYNVLTGYWVLNLQSFKGEAILDGNTLTWNGDYIGNDVRTYRTWDHSINGYTNEFKDEDTNYNGSYKINNLYKPEEVKMTIYGPSGYGLVIYADKAIGYSDMNEYSFGGVPQEGVLTFNKY